MGVLSATWESHHGKEGDIKCHYIDYMNCKVINKDIRYSITGL